MSEKKNEHSFIAEALLRTKRALLYVLLFSLCTNVMMLGLPLFSLQVLDRVISSASIPTLINLTIIITFVFIFYGIFSYVRSTILMRVGDWIDNNVSSRLLSIAVTQNSIGSPTPSSQHLRDLQSIRGFIGGGGVVALFDAPWSILFILVIYMINPLLGFITVLGGVLLLGFALLNELLTNKAQAQAGRTSLKAMSMADTASRNAEAIEAMGMMGNVRKRWEKESLKANALQQRVNGRSNLLLSTSRTIRLLLQAMITAFGAYMTIQNEMSVGGMIACSILAGRALAPFEAAISMWKQLVSARDSLGRLEKMIGGIPDSMRGNIRLPEPTGKLAVENVIFSPGGRIPIIKNVKFELNPGEMLGVIGPSAAGKSTLAKLIAGILPCTSGAVRLDGAEIFKWNREDLGQYIGYMPQQVDLFPGTVLDNIARMEEEPDHEKALAAAQAAAVHDMILRLPEGYETEIQPGNATVSPGQRQRIGLARALYNQPKFLVLDEPNINLDGEGEQALLRALANIRQMGITTVLVAHRPSLVNNTDKILILQNGAIKEFGPTQQVLQKYVAPAVSEAGA